MNSRLRWRSSWAVYSVVVFNTAALAQQFDPFAPDAAKKAPPSAFGDPIKGVRVPQSASGAVTFGPASCPVYLVGNQVWDVKSASPTVTIEIPKEYLSGRRALSDDGKWFAAASKSPNQTDTAVQVWSTETGKSVLEVPGVNEKYVDLLQFAGEKYLLLGGRHDKIISAWDVTTGKITKLLQTPDRRVESDKIAFAPGGRYFATVTSNGIVVTDVPTGKVVGGMELPPARPASLGPAEPAANPVAARLQSTFVFAWLRGMAFSPDSTEFAAFSTHPVPRLMVWNLKGKLILDDPIPGADRVGFNHVFQWLPDKSGWLIDGRLYDRASRRVVLTTRVPFASQIQPHLLDQNRLIGVFGKDEALRTIEIPWEAIRASITAMKEGDAFVTPAEAVSVDVSISNYRGGAVVRSERTGTTTTTDVEATHALLRKAVSERLTRSGLRTAAGQPTVVRLKLAESAGETLPIYERQTRFDFRGKDTGRKATEAKGTAVLEILAPGEQDPLWRTALSAFSSRSFDGDINDATVRQSMLENLARQLNDLDVPYFIPKSSTILALPVVIE